jgi:hypothetical protein
MWFQFRGRRGLRSAPRGLGLGGDATLSECRKSSEKVANHIKLQHTDKRTDAWWDIFMI